MSADWGVLNVRISVYSKNLTFDTDTRRDGLASNVEDTEYRLQTAVEVISGYQVPGTHYHVITSYSATRSFWELQ